jgi:hypothetical protein
MLKKNIRDKEERERLSKQNINIYSSIWFLFWNFNSMKLFYIYYYDIKYFYVKY